MNVREEPRPAGTFYRVLVSELGAHYLAFPVSTGPYKIDIERYHLMTRAEVDAYRSGTLAIANLAAALSELDWSSGRNPQSP